jgi:hypothetical protein
MSTEPATTTTELLKLLHYTTAAVTLYGHEISNYCSWFLQLLHDGELDSKFKYIFARGLFHLSGHVNTEQWIPEQKKSSPVHGIPL